MQAAPSTSQVIPLSAGWNLISIQVGSSFTPEQFKAAMSNQDRLQQIWGYHPTGNSALPGQWNTFQPLAPPGFPSDVSELVPGRGYWVKVSQASSVTLIGAAWSGPVMLVPGWNLVGFPGLDLGSTEAQELPAIFGTSFNRIQQVWTHNNASKVFEGYDLSAVPQLKQVSGVQAGRGYWVYATSGQPISLTGQPFVALPADSDASPPEPEAPYAGSNPRYVGRLVRTPGTGDSAYDLNANGILDDIVTQDTILFEKTADTVSVTIGNQETGALPWTLENGVPWLYTAPPDPRTWPAGVSSRPRAASGTVSSENDTLLLYADRGGMTPGRKSGDSVTLWVGGQAFPIHLLLDIASIDGDWRGSASTTRVGGRNVSIGEVRLVLNSFSSVGGEASGFRAVLNREQSLLFPRDVYMDGVFYSGNQFKLTTNFEMPAGDRNAPPYDSFPSDPKDRDFNGNGKVDLANPFPYGIRREVTLLGTRVTPSRLEGTYIESIRGMLPPLSGNTLVTDQSQFLGDAFLTQSQPVFIEGTFVLERQSFAPTKRSVFNESADLQLAIGGSETTGRLVNFTVTNPVTVQGVTLLLNLTFPDPALLQVRLVSPAGTSYLIHDFGDSSQLPSSITIPADIFAGENGAGAWTLQIDWDGSTGERGNLASWGLNIEGAATHKATGRIVASGSPVAGAVIRLEGGVATRTFTSSGVAGQEGTFEIPDLTENDYTLYISKPGYPATGYTFFVSEQDVLIGDIVLTPLAITEPQFTAAPPVGYAGSQPFHVEFKVDLPIGFGGTDAAWDFDGDGTTDQSGALAAFAEMSNDYAEPGIYQAKLTLSGGSLGTPVVKTQPIHVHRAKADAEGAGTQILMAGFVGSAAANVDIASASPAALPVVPLEDPASDVRILDRSGGSPVEILIPSVASGYIPQESAWDSATFDQDRYPYSWALPPPSAPGVEDSDFGVQTHVGGAPANGPAYIFFKATSTNPYKYDLRAALATDPAYDRTPGFYLSYTLPAGSTKPNRYRVAVALGGAVFNPTSSAIGDIRIQPGRTLP